MTLHSKKTDVMKLTLFAFTLFLSAAMIFGLQPMIGKMLLPIVGGTPSGWIVAIAFFQVILLMGYFLAYALSRFSPHTQGILYLLCLVGGIFFLPISLTGQGSLISETPGASDVFRLLTTTVAVPFIALSATVSTIQRLFMTTEHPSAKDPYFLYAASNLGSFSGLFLYLLLAEPKLTLTKQSEYLLYGYSLLIAAGIICLLFARKQPDGGKKEKHAATPVSMKQCMKWLALAFFPSSLMLAVTLRITIDIVSTPMIWVLPLGLYLLTFVIAFSRKPMIPYQAVLFLQPVVVTFSCALLLTMPGSDGMLSIVTVVWHLLTFTVISLMCHMILARSRPSGEDRELPLFYLMLAAGGALGGLLSAFILPVVLDRLIEYPFLLVASCIMHPNIRSKIHAWYEKLLLFCIASAGTYYIAWASGLLSSSLPTIELIAAFCSSLLVFLLLMTSSHPRVAAIGCLAAVVFSTFIQPTNLLLTHRSFYGVINVSENQVKNGGKCVGVRFMSNGSTIHGFQVMDQQYEKTPTSYYTIQSPIGNVFNAWLPKKVAVIGLGVGTMNCYSTPENDFTFFEIDPAVIRIAKENFTFLSACSTDKEPRIVLGDGRLELARLKGEKFNLIVLDAFSSDSIPTHLLTAEAMEEYLRHLEKNGLILFQTSSRYFNLNNPLTATAHSIGLKSRVIAYFNPSDPFSSKSYWVAVTRETINAETLDDLGWKAQETPRDLRPWTDNYTNLLKYATILEECTCQNAPI